MQVSIGRRRLLANDETAVPDRGEADRAVNTIAGLFGGPASSA